MIKKKDVNDATAPIIVEKKKQEPEIYNLLHGSYKGITKRNMFQYRVKYVSNLLENREFMNEYMNEEYKYKLFLDYDDNKLDIEECKKIILEHLLNKGLKIKEGMIKVCYKSDGSKKYHFVIPEYSGGVKEQKILWEGLKLKYDVSVYKKCGWFRLPNQKKPEANGKKIEEAYYIPLETAKLDDFILGKLEDFTKELPAMGKEELLDKEVIKKEELMYKKVITKEEIERIKKILDGLNETRSRERKEWIKIGMICKNLLGEDGLEVWDNFSRKCKEKYKMSDVIYQWNSFKENGELQEGSLMKMLEEDNKLLYDRMTKIDLDKIELFIMEIVNENKDSHIMLGELYKMINPDLLLSSGSVDDNIFNNYYFEEKSGRFLIDASNGIFLSGIKNMIEKISILIEKLKDKNKIDEIEILKRIRKNIGNKGTFTAIKETIIPKYWVDNLSEKLDSKMNLIGFNNGVYDLDNGEFRKGKYDEYVSKTVGYDYPKEDKKKQEYILKVIYETCKNEDDFNALMFELAYILDGNKKYEIITSWTGRGGNGKTIITDMMMNCLGEYFQELNAGYLTNYDEKSNSPQPELASLKGVRMVVINEINEDQKLLVSKLKRLTTSINVRTLHRKERIKFKPQFITIMHANEMPSVSAVQDAIIRRLYIRNFPYQFKPENPLNIPEIKICIPNLQKIIIEEKLGEQLMLILLDYYSKNVKNSTKYYISESMEKYSKEYFDDSNPVLMWFKENYEITNNDKDRISCNQLYNNFKITNKEIDIRKFSNFIQQIGVIKKKLTSGNYYLNIKQKNIEEDD
jgi:P4 family phage/plasmid primase-like protien